MISGLLFCYWINLSTNRGPVKVSHLHHGCECEWGSFESAVSNVIVERCYINAPFAFIPGEILQYTSTSQYTGIRIAQCNKVVMTRTTTLEVHSESRHLPRQTSRSFIICGSATWTITYICKSIRHMEDFFHWSPFTANDTRKSSPSILHVTSSHFKLLHCTVKNVDFKTENWKKKGSGFSYFT